MSQASPYARFFAAVRRRGPWVVLATFVVAAASFGVSKALPKKYSATANVVFTLNNLNQQVANLQSSAVIPTQQLQDTDLALVSLGNVASETARQVGRGLTAEGVRNMLSITQLTDTNVVQITATSTRPRLATDVANDYAMNFVQGQENQNRGYYSTALALVTRQINALTPQQRNSSAGLALIARQQSLTDLAALPTGSAQLAQPAVYPTTPSSPRPTRNAILGGFIALLLGIGTAVVLEGLDRFVREASEFEQLYELPTLGVIPRSKALEQPGAGVSPVLVASETDIFQLVHAHLRYFNVDRTLKTLLVTSSTPGDGKTTVSCHLAAAGALLGFRTFLLDADLRRSTVARKVAAPNGKGLADVLVGACALDEAVQSIPVKVSAEQPASDASFDVLLAGVTLPPNPAQLIESKAMHDLLETLSGSYDLVIVDTPPLTAVSDGFSLLREVDGVIVVARSEWDTRAGVVSTKDALDRAGAPSLGLVVNAAKPNRDGYYGYRNPYASGVGKEALPQVQPPSTLPSAGSTSTAD